MVEATLLYVSAVVTLGDNVNSTLGQISPAEFELRTTQAA